MRCIALNSKPNITRFFDWRIENSEKSSSIRFLWEENSLQSIILQRATKPKKLINSKKNSWWSDPTIIYFMMAEHNSWKLFSFLLEKPIPHCHISRLFGLRKYMHHDTEQNIFYVLFIFLQAYVFIRETNNKWKYLKKNRFKPSDKYLFSIQNCKSRFK